MFSYLIDLPILNELKISNQEALILAEKLKKEAMESKKSMLQNSEKTKVIGKQLEEVRNLLKQVIRENVKQLVQYIFPICCEGQISRFVNINIYFEVHTI